MAKMRPTRPRGVCMAICTAICRRQNAFCIPIRRLQLRWHPSPIGKCNRATKMPAGFSIASPTMTTLAERRAEQESARLAAALGDMPVLVMRGHGIKVIGESVAAAFDLLYYFERSCKNQWLAMASGKALYQIAESSPKKPPDNGKTTLRQNGTSPSCGGYWTSKSRITSYK